MSDRTRSKTPTYAERAELDGEDTRPGIPAEQLRRRKSSQQLRAAVTKMAQGSGPPEPHESYGELRARVLELQAERVRDAEALRELDEELRVMRIRAEDAERKLRELRGVER